MILNNRHDFKNFNEVQFKSELCDIDWKSVLEINKKDVDFSFSKFFETFNNLLQKHAPIKKLSNKDKKTMKKPWITKGILKSIEEKNRIYRKCIRTKNSTKNEEMHNLFKYYRNSLNKIARLSKANHYKAFFEDNKNKLNKVWKGIKEIININKKDTQQIRNINNNRKLITEKKQIANIFNHFFCNIQKQIEIGIIPTQKTYDDFLTNPIEQSFKFDLTSDEEIITYIKTLKNNKSNGPFSI